MRRLDRGARDCWFGVSPLITSYVVPLSHLGKARETISFIAV